jgi:hypothetical protein
MPTDMGCMAQVFGTDFPLSGNFIFNPFVIKGELTRRVLG